MKLINILTTLVVSGGLASVQAQHHLPATSKANINGGINSPTSGNIDIEGVAVITDKADDTTRKLHDILTSVKGIMEEEFGLATAVEDGSGRRLSKSHKSDKGIGMIEEVLLALLLVIVLLLAEFLWIGGYDTSKLDGLLGAGTGEEGDDIADEITAAHHGHDGSSSKTAKSGGTDGSAKASKESKSSKSGGACPIIGPFTEGDPCCSSEDCENGGSTRGFCQVVEGDFCIDGDAAAGSVDCSTGNTCTGSPDQGSCTGTGELCIIVPIETCTPATAPATGTCFFVPEEFTCPGSGPGDNSVGEGGACCEDADCSCADGGCRECIDDSSGSPIIAPATGICELL